MPVIDGVKMACAPCIRGHRATRCNHGGERPLLQVRKPGRPLSACSCIPGTGKPCSCGAGVRLAIPLKKACKCETVKDEPDESHDTTTVATPAATRSSAVPACQKPFRVEKAVARQNRKRSTCNQAQLERMDPAAFNIIMPPSISPYQVHPKAQDASMALKVQASTQLSASFLGLNNSLEFTGSEYQQAAPSISNLDLPLGPTSFTPAKKSCCGGGTGDRKMNNLTSIPPGVLGGGIPQQYIVNPPNGTDFRFSINSYAGDGGLPPNTYAGYGTISQPITPQIWAQMQLQQQTFLQQPRTGLSSTNIPPAQLLPDSNNNNNQVQDTGYSHQCSCGPGCRCIGCVSHPFNLQTMQYVNTAYDMTPEGPGAYNANFGESHCYAASERTLPTPTPPSPNQDQVEKTETGSPFMRPDQGMTPPQGLLTPSDASGLGDEQQVSSAEYYWIELPCGGLQATCFCGADCACEGCMIHNNDPLPSLFP